MSRFNESPPQIGFSTGALERGNYQEAVSWMLKHEVHTMELSALRFDELRPLVEGLEQLPLKEFEYVSFHAPSAFAIEQEGEVIELLQPVAARGWNIVLHPDVLYTPDRWSCFGPQLLIENMDRRKAVGRTVPELTPIFAELPQARLCLDVAHARQLDTTLVLLWDLVRTFTDRIAEIHISELDSRCRHQPMSRGAVVDFQQVLGRTLSAAPVIVESMLDERREGLRMEELQMAHDSVYWGQQEFVGSAEAG